MSNKLEFLLGLKELFIKHDAYLDSWAMLLRSLKMSNKLEFLLGLNELLTKHDAYLDSWDAIEVRFPDGDDVCLNSVAQVTDLEEIIKEVENEQ